VKNFLITVYLLLSVLSYDSFGQTQMSCGTPSPTIYSRVCNNSDQEVKAKSIQSENPINIGLAINVFRTSDGEENVPLSEIKTELDFLNEAYANTNMNFFILGEVNFIDADRLYYFDLKDHSNDNEEIDNLFAINGAVNIYYLGPVTEGSNFPIGWCGLSYFPEEGFDKVLLSGSCASGPLLAHEMGHLFSLLHTQEKSFGAELVNGSNCDVAGDLLCDTPADPGITSAQTAITCHYQGGAVDAAGDQYQPDVSNLMSYAADECRTSFSPEQINLIVTTYHEYKTHLISDSSVARFAVANREICKEQTADFKDLSIGAKSYHWVFEGGTPATSQEINPEIVYQNIGSFDVTLTITDQEGHTNTQKLTDYIKVDVPTTAEVSLHGDFEEELIQERIRNPDYRFTFETTDHVSSSGERSAMINFYDYYESPKGQEDYLILGIVNNASLKTCNVSFDYAYAAFSEVDFDKLALVYGDPCSDYWTELWSKEGVELQTSSEYVDDQMFVPVEADWKHESIEVNLPESIELVEFAFRTKSGWGNALYLDNYQINAAPNKPEIVHEGKYLVLDHDEMVTVMWYKDGDLLVGESQSQLLIDENGVYEAKVSNGICATRSDPINVFTLSSHLAKEMNLSLYPNPVRNQLHIDVPEDFSWHMATMTIKDMTGKPLIIGPFKNKIDLLGLTAGVYMLSIVSGEVQWSSKFIKRD
jgi:PKD repeat protein